MGARMSCVNSIRSTPKASVIRAPNPNARPRKLRRRPNRLQRRPRQPPSVRKPKRRMTRRLEKERPSSDLPTVRLQRRKRQPRQKRNDERPNQKLLPRRKRNRRNVRPMFPQPCLVAASQNNGWVPTSGTRLQCTSSLVETLRLCHSTPLRVCQWHTFAPFQALSGVPPACLAEVRTRAGLCHLRDGWQKWC